MGPTELTDQLREALDAVGQLIARIGPDQWSSPTPCTEWTVRDVVNHLVDGNRLAADVLNGELLPPLEGLRARRAIDYLEGDPLGAYRGSATALVDAFEVPGRFEQLVSLPVGTMPGRAAVVLRVTETLTHGWDLARGTGQTLEVPDELTDQALRFTVAQLPKIPAGRTPFAPPQPAPDDAPALDRLAAALGRNPTWSP
jgi:uncharacterized protein (TIGR03086 family)